MIVKRPLTHEEERALTVKSKFWWRAAQLKFAETQRPFYHHVEERKKWIWPIVKKNER